MSWRGRVAPWTNFIAYQAVWFAIVYAAGHGQPLPGVLAALLFACVQWTWSEQRSSDLRLMLSAIVVGVAFDGALRASGLVHYSSARWALPAGGAPVWILALWASFALTLNHSLRWLRGRWLAGALLGAVGGPLAFVSASRMSGAVELAPPRWHAVIGLALGWSLAAGLLAHLAGRWKASQHHVSPAVLIDAPGSNP